MIGMCVLAYEYNIHMGGSDSNAQVRANYQSNIRVLTWPWSLTKYLLLIEYVYNAYYLYKLIHLEEISKRMAYIDFQHEIAIKLLNHPEVFGRKRPLIVSILTTNKGFTLPEKHRFFKILKRGYYIVCKIIKKRLAKRQVFREIDGNGIKRRKRGLQSWYVCIECLASYCC